MSPARRATSSPSAQPAFACAHPRALPVRLLRAEQVNRTQPINYAILEFSSVFKCLTLFLSKQTQERQYVTKQKKSRTTREHTGIT